VRLEDTTLKELLIIGTLAARAPSETPVSQRETRTIRYRSELFTRHQEKDSHPPLNAPQYPFRYISTSRSLYILFCGKSANHSSLYCDTKEG